MKYLSIVITAASLLQAPLHAAEDYLSGNIINLTSGTSGLMIQLDSGIPNNCRGTPYGWILIKEENKAITSVALTMWASGKKSGTVYTAPAKPGDYCTVTQLHPNS